MFLGFGPLLKAQVRGLPGDGFEEVKVDDAGSPLFLAFSVSESSAWAELQGHRPSLLTPGH